MIENYTFKNDSNLHGNLKIIGNGHSRIIFYEVPEWSEDNEVEPCFKYKGDIYFLSEFELPSEHVYPFSNYDGVKSESYFSGVLIKFVNDNVDEALKVYSYYC